MDRLNDVALKDNVFTKIDKLIDSSKNPKSNKKKESYVVKKEAKKNNEPQQAKVVVEYQKPNKVQKIKANENKGASKKKAIEINYNYKIDPKVVDKENIRSWSEINRNVNIYSKRFAENPTPTRTLKKSFFCHIADNWEKLASNNVVRCNPKEAENWMKDKDDKIFSIFYDPKVKIDKNKKETPLLAEKVK